MLKALELVGFKSFADKTRFDFPEGITVVVGPNGSGKSNIVDAIKWVLGEQSAKSLRGKEMADVIFKGTSGPNGRKAANAAEATIIIENSDKRFDLDTDEIHITRRVYRSGEGEYLINGDQCRLKDIRNMFRGTGVGTDAYSLIEQGKVERLLQASPKDRRAIFEEAAGISRFNAKKVEAQRRLARVDQNLIRLADIVEEVGGRFRSIKSQASKAARYKEFTARLRELRTHVGATDWREFNLSLEKLSSENEKHKAEIESAKKQIDALINEDRQVEQQLGELNSGVQEQQERFASLREKIANLQSEIKANEDRIIDIDSRDSRFRESLSKFGQRLTELVASKSKYDLDLAAARGEQSQTEGLLSQEQATLDQTNRELHELTQKNENDRKQYSDLISLVAELEKQLSVARAQEKTTSENKTRIEQNVSELETNLQENVRQVEALDVEIAELNQQVESKDSALAQARQKLTESQNQLEDVRHSINELTRQHAGSVQRREMIIELEKNLEGINSGPRQLLRQAQETNEKPYDEIVGLVAELVQVNVQQASIVDIALAQYGQYVVVRGDNLVRAIVDEKIKFSGRVGIIQIDKPIRIGSEHDENLKGVAGVIGRVDQIVQAKTEFEPLVRRMLSGTWLVKKLADALHIRETRNTRARFVTLDGEIVEPNGTIVVGPNNVATGIVSRRSELRALEREIKQLDQDITQSKEKSAALTATSAEQEKSVQQLLAEHTEAAAKIREKQSLLKNARQLTSRCREQLTAEQRSLQQTVEKLSSFATQIAGDHSHLDDNQNQIQTLSAIIDQNEIQIKQLQSTRGDLEKKITSAKVNLARSSQRVDQLASELNSAANQLTETNSTISQTRGELAGILWSRRQSRHLIKTAASELATCESERDSLDAELQQVAMRRGQMENRRRELREKLDSFRDELKLGEDRRHGVSLKQEKLQLQREQLQERLREDYGIEVAELEKPLSDEQQAQRDEIDSEIKDLRKKISNIGSVNMDALAELEETEGRYNTLNDQYQDLVAAKEELEKIIVRINTDSRRLYSETLHAIRLNFQQLFRQTFGGGRADIILEDGVDILEAGIEIVATPPGKPEFNNSLLSGGEKALTAVSLLMAIFKFRPSPFCVLDEVDAPFDEANIGRFIEVLKSFLGWTKFVIVTHSKKTMTAATTLYGVTMQESGISKRVSVRFEEVGEAGEIAHAAVERTVAEETDSADGSERGVA